MYQVHCKAQEQEIKTYLYMVVLTAHRIGELLQLTKDDIVIDEKKIISPEEITKTGEEYHFPIPDECLSYIENIKNGLIFPTLKRGSIYNIFQRLVNIAVDIGKINFYEGKTVSPHDMRRIMLHIMIINCGVDSMLADSCLSHKQKGSTKNYVDFTDENIREAYQKYWDILALTGKEYNDKYNKVSTTQHNSSVMNNTDKLVKLLEMLDRGLITEVEFKKQKSFLT
jgi:integrase